MISFSNRQLKVKVKTWTRDSYGLYDYENSNLQVQNLTISEACKLSRVNNEITTAEPSLNLTTATKSEGKEHKKGPACLVSIGECPDGLKIVPNKIHKDDLDEEFWTIIERGEAAKGYMLKVDDVIKFGRVMFKINQIRVVEDSETANCPQKKAVIDSIKSHMQKDDKAKNNNGKLERKMSHSDVICKICLSEKAEKDDPLISPCNCTGSVKYVHLQCCQNWVKSKLNMQQNKNIITIFWKNLFCELCKEKFPMSIEHDGEELSLLPIADKINGSYIAIESFSKAKDSMGIHIIDLSSNQAFKMGRGHECDLKIPDISVSRVHALLVISKGKVYLKDNMSKFGTLVLQKDPFVLNDENSETPWVQCGRTILKFTAKKSWTAFLPTVTSFLGLNKFPKLNKLFGDEKSNQETTRQVTQDGEEA